MKTKNSLLLKAALTGIVLTGSAAYADDAKTPAKNTETVVEGKCMGANACKGKSDCGGKEHTCHGKNSCKGKGWVKMTKENCLAAKGTFEELKGM